MHSQRWKTNQNQMQHRVLPHQSNSFHGQKILLQMMEILKLKQIQILQHRFLGTMLLEGRLWQIKNLHGMLLLAEKQKRAVTLCLTHHHLVIRLRHQQKIHLVISREVLEKICNQCQSQLIPIIRHFLMIHHLLLPCLLKVMKVMPVIYLMKKSRKILHFQMTHSKSSTLARSLWQTSRRLHQRRILLVLSQK